jgi:fructokinase
MQFCRTNKKLSQRPSPTIVGTGLFALDVVVDRGAATAETCLGGSAGNVLAILGHLGWGTVPIGQLGQDAAATKIANEFSRLGADTRFLMRSQHQSTPVVYQLPGKAGHTHEFSFRCPVCGRKRGYMPPVDDGTGMSQLRSLDAPDVFYFDRATPWALELAERYREGGTLVVFEPSAIGSDLASFERAIRATHILKYADDRIVEMKGVDLTSVDVQIQTQGKKGLRFRVSGRVGEWHHLDAISVPYLADTAGAGDWCTSGFLYAMLGNIFENGGRGMLSVRRIRESLRFGQILSALNCMEKGARGLARRHRSVQLVSLAASIRNSMASSVPSREADIAKKSAQPRLTPAVGTADAMSALLCCEAFSG